MLSFTKYCHFGNSLKIKWKVVSQKKKFLIIIYFILNYLLYLQVISFHDLYIYVLKFIFYTIIFNKIKKCNANIKNWSLNNIIINLIKNWLE